MSKISKKSFGDVLYYLQVSQTSSVFCPQTLDNKVPVLFHIVCPVQVRRKVLGFISFIHPSIHPFILSCIHICAD
jgi:hypothetical protein